MRGYTPLAIEEFSEKHDVWREEFFKNIEIPATVYSQFINLGVFYPRILAKDQGSPICRGPSVYGRLDTRRD